MAKTMHHQRNEPGGHATTSDGRALAARSESTHNNLLGGKRDLLQEGPIPFPLASQFGKFRSIVTNCHRKDLENTGNQRKKKTENRV